MRLTKRVLSLSILVGSLAASVLAAEWADAAVEKIVVATEMFTDAETGNQGIKVFNPKREVDLTFTNTGLEVKFEDVTGQLRTFRLFADFEMITSKPESEGEGRYNRMMNAAMESDGARMAGYILKGTAKGIAESGGHLILRFDSSRKVGFVVNDYNYSEVSMVIPGNPPVTLRDMVQNNLSMQMNKTIGEQMLQEAKANEKPIGFMHNKEAVAWGGPKMIPMCEPLFIPAGRSN